MKKIQVIMRMGFDRKEDADLYHDYCPLNLLLASAQGKEEANIQDTIEEIESTMDKGKKYRIIIEELE